MFINPLEPPETPCFSWLRRVEEERSKEFSELSGQFRGSCLSAFHRDSWVFYGILGGFRGVSVIFRRILKGVLVGLVSKRLKNVPRRHKMCHPGGPRVFQGVSRGSVVIQGVSGDSKGTQNFPRGFMGVSWNFRGFQRPSRSSQGALK